MADEVGTLEVGKQADILLIDGDPLGDITLLQQREHLVLVAQGGRARRKAPGLDWARLTRWVGPGPCCCRNRRN